MLLLMGIVGTAFPAVASSWVGVWETADQWGSVYYIEIKDDNRAMSTYGDGWHGDWQKAGGGVRITWDSKGGDFIFNGVMGKQRVHTPPPRWGMAGFSSYMKKIDALPPEAENVSPD